MLLNDVLDLAKLRAGKILMRPEPTAIRPLLEAVVGLFRPTSTERGVELRLTIDDDVPKLGIIDPTRLRQMLGNLVGNAVKFTEHGHVAVRARRKGDRLCVDVEDTGAGHRARRP